MGILSWFLKDKEAAEEIKKELPPQTPIVDPEKNGEIEVVPDKSEIVINIDNPGAPNSPNLDEQPQDNTGVAEPKKDPKTEKIDAKKGKDKITGKQRGNAQNQIKPQRGNNGLKKTTIKKNKSFTDRQWRFVEEYLIDFNGKQAAIRAGYTKTNATEAAHDVLSYAHVVAEISKRREMISDKAESDAVYVMRRLKAESVDVINGNAASRVRALELIGKRNGMFTDKIQHQVEALQININTDVTTTFKSPDSQDDNGEQTGSESTESNDASQ